MKARFFYIIFFLGIVFFIPACGEINSFSQENSGGNDDPGLLSSPTQCRDSIDNDSDGLIDLNDPGCANVADDDESDGLVGAAHDATRANSYDNAWELDWIAKTKTVIAMPIVGVTKILGKVLHVGDSITYSNAYGSWARSGAGATSLDQEVISWMHADSSDSSLNGWVFSTKSTTSMNGAGWWDSVIDSVLGDASLRNAHLR